MVGGSGKIYDGRNHITAIIPIAIKYGQASINIILTVHSYEASEFDLKVPIMTLPKINPIAPYPIEGTRAIRNGTGSPMVASRSQNQPAPKVAIAVQILIYELRLRMMGESQGNLITRCWNETYRKGCRGQNSQRRRFSAIEVIRRDASPS